MAAASNKRLIDPVTAAANYYLEAATDAKLTASDKAKAKAKRAGESYLSKAEKKRKSR